MDIPRSCTKGRRFLVVASIMGLTPVAALNQAITVSSISLNPASVAGGNVVTGTVTISAPAPQSGFRVQLGSSDPQRAQPASLLTIAAGQLTGQFVIQTFPIDQHPGTVDPDPTTTISAWDPSTPKGVRRTASLTVTPAALAGMTVETPIPSGTSADATVMLSGPAPASGVTISLTSNHPSDRTMPSSVAIPPGARTASFVITPNPEIYDRTFEIQARRSSFDTKQTQLFVRIPEPERLTCLGRPSNLPEFTGGNDVKCNVRLDGRAPFDYGVTLESSDKDYAIVEKLVTVPNGRWDTDLVVQTKPVGQPRTVTVTGNQRGKTVSVTFRLVAARLMRVVVDPDPATGGQPVNVTVSLTGPTISPLSITVDSSDPSVFQVLTPITINAGGTVGGQEVSTSELDQNRTVRATARLGSASVQDEFVIKHTPRPDLLVSVITARPTARFYVRNWGEADAPASTLEVQTLNSAGDVVGRTALQVPPLPRQVGQAYLQLPVSCRGCRLYADAPNEIKESNETNNSAIVQ